MKSCAALILLILMQASPAGSPESYEAFVKKADLITTAWLTDIVGEAAGDQARWVVTYQVKEVLKGNHSADSLTLRFDSSSFKHADRSGRGTKEKHNILILFLRDKGSGNFQYVGPPLNSPTIIGSAANLAVLRQKIAEQGQLHETTWYDTRIDIIIKGTTIRLVLVGVFVVALIVLILLRKRSKQTAEIDDMR